ncbi:hypothetical protein BH20ACT8_BH20ACT8_13420 [soil metagenome]
MRLSHRTKQNPVFYADRLRIELADDPERVERAFTDPDSVDLLSWNVFASLDTDSDRDYLTALLRPFCGNDLTPPVSLSLWTGKEREPQLTPSPQYVRHVRQRAGEDQDVSAFTCQIEVPVRIESRAVLGLVDVAVDSLPGGAGGRDRLTELIDAGAVQAHRIGKQLAVAVVYRSGTPAAAALSARINALRTSDGLRKAMPWADPLPEVRLREVPWQQLVRVWENERKHFRLFAQPVGGFLAHAERLGLR